MPCEIQTGGGIKNLRARGVIPYRYKRDNSHTDWKAGHIAADIGRKRDRFDRERDRMRAKRGRLNQKAGQIQPEAGQKSSRKLYEISTQWE